MDANIITLMKRLWAGRKVVVIMSGAGFLLGIAFALMCTKKYDVVAKVMPEYINQKTPLGALASLSGIGGVLSNLQNGTDAIYPEIYPDLIRSYPFLAELMAMPVSFCDGDDTVHTNLYDYKLNYERKMLFHRHIDTIPSSFDVSHLTRREDRILRRIRRDIKVTVDKKTTLVTITATSRNPQIAADLCDSIIGGLKNSLLGYYHEKAVKDLEYLQLMTEQAREEYYTAQSRYAATMDSNQGLSLQSSKLRQQRLRSEMNLAGQLYDQLAKKEQTARIKVQENKPVLAVIQPAVIPYKGHPSRIKIVFIMTFLAFAVSCVWVMFFKDEFSDAENRKS